MTLLEKFQTSIHPRRNRPLNRFGGNVLPKVNGLMILNYKAGQVYIHISTKNTNLTHTHKIPHILTHMHIHTYTQKYIHTHVHINLIVKYTVLLRRSST